MFRELAFYVLTGLVLLGTTVVCPGYYNSTPKVSSERTLLNVYTIKDKP